MRKALSVFALIALACNISRYVLVHADPVRKPEAAGPKGDYEYQMESHEQFESTEVPRRILENQARYNEPVGKWRSNGEALEPKWRDGDSVPSLPFSHYRSYTRDDVDDVEQEDLRETSQRPLKYRYSINQQNQPGNNLNKRIPSPNEYETTNRNYDYDNPDEDYSRNSYRQSKNPNGESIPRSALYGEIIETSESNNRKRNHNTVGDLLNDDRQATSARYREAFQARPNEYEHELSDEEYLRPRPRKRRPPSYEFIPTNEASLGNRELKDSSRLPLRLKENEDLQTTQSSSNNERTQNGGRKSENALELKSLLKMQQQEGSSLSEILQRRNLTLSDLLKGKADVINALRSRIADESDEYIEEMSRVMSNSLMKLSATASPSWRTIQTSTVYEDTVVKTVASTSDIPDHSTSSSTAKSYEKVFLNDTAHVKKELTDIKNMSYMNSVHDPSWMKTTTPLSIPTVITTSTSLPGTMNSMEYFLNDDSNVGLTNDRATKLESLDEDEIMEFSDFTDFKKGKSPTSPTWLSITNEKIVSQPTSEAADLRDVGSTLSIEHILNPTERIKLAKDCTTNQDDDDDVDNNNNEGTVQDNIQSVPNRESSADYYNTFIEAEYQNDAPIDVTEDNEKQSTVKVDLSTNKSSNSLIKKEKQNDTYDKNHTNEYHQVNRSGDNMEEKQYDRALKNHRRTNSRRYDEVISEIEPEARAEIFELFASGSAGKRLERLLKSRNMSIEELIALRQRGSSKVHLTEVSRLKVPKPKGLQFLDTKTGTTSTNNEEIIIPLSSTNNIHNEHLSEDMKNEDTRREKSINQFKEDIMSYLHDSFFDKDVENMSMSRLLDLVERDRNASREGTFSNNDSRDLDEYSELENSRQGMQIVDLLTTFSSIPFLKDVQRQFETDDHEQVVETKLPNNHNASVLLIDKEETIRSNNSSEFHAGYMEEIVNEEPNTIDIQTIYGETISSTSGTSAGEERKTLFKVKPNIIASGAILGVTIVVFLAIFIVCRIRQKQKYTYRNTFSRAVFQGPVLAARKLSNSSSLSTVMVNVVATSTTKRPEKTETQEAVEEFDGRSDIDNDSLDANDSWETIPDYAK